MSKKERKIYRFLEIIPGCLSWLTLIGLFSLSFLKPVEIAIFIICFDFYWLVKIGYLSFHMLGSYSHMRKEAKINWLEKLKKEKTQEWEKIYHLIILPTLKEPIEVLETSYKSLSKVNYPKEKMIVVFAGEERDKQRAVENAKKIKEKYGNKFFKFLFSLHPKNVPGELAGKGANQAFAAKKAKELIDQLRIPYENIIVSVFDCDSCLHQEYFSCLTYKFLQEKNPYLCSYQPLAVFQNNIWDAPAFARVISISTTLWLLMEQARPEKLVTFSSHSMSFKTLVEIGFWRTNIVSEDSNIFWQCFLHFKGKYRVVPFYVSVSMDAVLGENLWQTIKAQYKQQRRWAWGVENFSYSVFGFFKNREIPFFKRAVCSFRLLEQSHSWATHTLIIAFLGWLPLLAAKESFQGSVLIENLPFLTGLIMQIAMLGLLIPAIISCLMLPKRPPGHGRHKFLYMILQWLLLPLTLNLFGAIPALDAQTRMMLGKYLGYDVTKKVRK